MENLNTKTVKGAARGKLHAGFVLESWSCLVAWNNISVINMILVSKNFYKILIQICVSISHRLIKAICMVII